MIPRDLNTKLKEALIEASTISGQPAMAVVNPDGTPINISVSVANVNQGNPNNDAHAWPVRITDGTHDAFVTVNGALQVDGSAATQPISVSSLPLPTGASTSALQTTGNNSLASMLANQTNGTQVTSITGSVTIAGTVTANQGSPPWSQNLTQVGGSPIALGQAAMALSLPVVIANNQSNLPVSIQNATLAVTQSGSWNVGVSGTVTANQGGAPWSMTLSGQPIFTYSQLQANSNQYADHLSVTDTSSHTLVPAQGAGIYADLTLLEITNDATSATVLTISDGTKTYKYSIASSGGAIIPMQFFPKKAASSNTAWTAQLSVASNVEINVQAVTHA